MQIKQFPKLFTTGFCTKQRSFAKKVEFIKESHLRYDQSFQARIKMSKLFQRWNAKMTYSLLYTKANYSTFNETKKSLYTNGKLLKEMKINNTRVQVVKGDLTAEDCDCIVNAANEYLAHGGGVAGAISRKGGPEVQEGSNAIIKRVGKVSTGKAVVQRAPSHMKCKYIIHAVGPIWRTGTKEPDQLASCIQKSLEIADRIDPPLMSISFPAISSGIFGFPKGLCAKIFFDVINKYLAINQDTNLRYIRLTNFDDPTVRKKMGKLALSNKAGVFLDEINSRLKKVESQNEIKEETKKETDQEGSSTQQTKSMDEEK